MAKTEDARRNDPLRRRELPHRSIIAIGVARLEGGGKVEIPSSDGSLLGGTRRAPACFLACFFCVFGYVCYEGDDPWMVMDVAGGYDNSRSICLSVAISSC